MLLDTEAGQTVMGWSLGIHLGFPTPQEDERIWLVRVTGDSYVHAYQRYVQLHLLGHAFLVPVWWLTSEQTLPLLGRRGFLQRFDVQVIEPHIYLRWRGHRWYSLQRQFNLGWQRVPPPQTII
ncbi:MAG TPA: hypothetical protein EYP85_01565 [Armatimonadetes bacterium]|nr:hypothetical protein [Armatimonadota bacterium]